MNAVIVGCGKVGSELAAMLVNEGHDVSVIDNNQQALSEAAEEIDILTVWGNGADINTLREAGLDTADIFIAVSPSDELNLLSCLIAGSAGSVRTIARVRNPLFSKETEFLKERLGLCKIINPEHIAAVEIFKLLQYPALSRIDTFAEGRVAIYDLPIKPYMPLIGKNLQQIREEMGGHLLACAGSTGGGIKVSRIMLMMKGYIRELYSILHPGIVKRVHMDGKAADEQVMRATGCYFFIYMLILAGSILLVSFDGLDWTTNYTAVVATFNNIGPGLGLVGTVGNYSSFSNFSKLILSADMLIGRLEIFPIMLLFAKGTWRKF